MTPPDLLQQIADAIFDLDQKKVLDLTEQALATRPPFEIVSHGLSRGMQKVGEQFKTGEIFIPEVMVACDCYYAGLRLVKPHLAGTDSYYIGKMVLGTIHGDIHTVGKDVAMPVFQAAGFDVVDLGVAVPDEQFVAAIREHQPQLVGLGTYMTSTFMHTRDTVQAIAQAGLRSKVKIICGGPSVSVEAARRLGADDASDNAWEAVEKMKHLLHQLAQEQEGRSHE